MSATQNYDKNKLYDVIVIGGGRVGELYGYIGGRKLSAVESFRVVDINLANNLVATLQGYLLYHVAHLAIAY